MRESHNIMNSVKVFEAEQMFKDTFEEKLRQEPYEIQLTAFLALYLKNGLNTHSILSGALIHFIYHYTVYWVSGFQGQFFFIMFFCFCIQFNQ